MRCATDRRRPIKLSRTTSEQGAIAGAESTFTGTRFSHVDKGTGSSVAPSPPDVAGDNRRVVSSTLLPTERCANYARRAHTFQAGTVAALSYAAIGRATARPRRYHTQTSHWCLRCHPRRRFQLLLQDQDWKCMGRHRSHPANPATTDHSLAIVTTAALGGKQGRTGKFSPRHRFALSVYHMRYMGAICLMPPKPLSTSTRPTTSGSRLSLAPKDAQQRTSFARPLRSSARPARTR